ncbi:nucleoside hydrolase [Rhizobiaceae bacterium n13]|uniref:Nucleoside hydrolase n=1 Tax=Ferirhizobium litorale TaxID=2927786 RepID=A0AAE3U309_9HYPH|nr:nucleoside hydrolase [Fererhizobium litorale]MDI7861805.1 nucleoside hydrolase [Fererhizobium litorale]MDI7921853.1 nucleoside hydrolase [Fererhizobium litorale]
MAQHRIILDCDPGVDDALALMLALAAPDAIELVGVTTVAGNVALEDTTRNAQGLLALASRPDIELRAGCARPLMRPVGYRSKVHGPEGLGGIRLEHSATLSDQHAVDFIIDTVLANPGQITLCPIGPMTNIALAMVREPRIIDAVREIVFMGGSAFGPGNSTPAAEFNVYVDPHAAHIVVSSGAKLTMFGLDVTRKLVATPERLARLAQAPGHAARTVVEMLVAYAQGDPCLHDPSVVAWLIDPSLFTGVDALVEIDCNTGPNLGRTLASVSTRHLGDRKPNCHVVTDGDVERIFELVEARLRSLA